MDISGNTQKVRKSMKSVFEKIIEKLEERTSFLSDCTKYGNNNAEQQDDLIKIIKAGVKNE